MSTIHKASNMKTTIIQNCKRPSETPTSAKTACKLFRDISRMELQILKLIDDYNYYMNGVDQLTSCAKVSLEPGAFDKVDNMLYLCISLISS
jgi:hypothetical protein